MKDTSLNHILEVKVFVPLPARNWEIVDLPFSKDVYLLLKKASYITLEELNGKRYSELFELFYANERCIKELYKVLTSMTSLDGFRTVEFQVQVAKQRRINDHSKEILINQPAKKVFEQNKTSKFDTPEDPKIILIELDSKNSVPDEIKDIFSLMEIDESTNYLQLKPEKEVEEVSIEKVITIPIECHNIAISELDLSIRLYNVLRRLEIHKLGDLQGKNIAEIRTVKNCGQKSLDELCMIIEMVSDGFKQEKVIDREKISVPEILADVPVTTLNSSVRLTNVLVSLDIVQLRDLRNFSLAEIKSAENCGNKTTNELRNFVEKFTDENWVEEICQKRVTVPQNKTKKIIVSTLIKDISLNRFVLSPRLKNILENLNVKKLADLENFAIRDFLKVKNFGRKTLDELKDFVERIERAINPEDLFENKNSHLATGLDLNGLLTFINSFLHELPERECEIFLKRFGGTTEGRVSTLEELGEYFSLTRERVRQIESKNLKELQNRLTGIVENALNDIKLASEEAVCPLNVRFLIHLTGNDYDLFIYPPNFYLNLLSKLSPEIHLFTNGKVSAKSAELVKKIKNLLDEEVHFLTISEVFERLHHYQSFGFIDFFQAIQHKYFILEDGDTPDVLLISTDKNNLTMTEIAWQILKNSAIALLPEEIIEKAKQIFGTETEFPSKHSLANLPLYDRRFYLLDKRRIGLRWHFQLPEEKWDEVANDFYKLLLEKQRPVSTTEVCNENLFKWTSQTTASETTEILRQDIRFKDLGRFLFALAEWKIEEREPIKDIIIKVLQEADEALTAAEIGRQIHKYRSASLTTLPTILRELDEIETFEFGYYGLKSKGDYRYFFTTDEGFLKRLIKKNAPITFSELCRKLEITKNKELIETLWGKLQTVPNFRVSSEYPSPEAVIKFTFWKSKVN